MGIGVVVAQEPLKFLVQVRFLYPLPRKRGRVADGSSLEN